MTAAIEKRQQKPQRIERLSANFSFVACLLLATVVATLYSVSLGHNFLFDEENLIIWNPYIKDLSLIPELFKRGFFYFQGRATPLWTEYYRPLTSVTFALDYHFWKGNPLGYNLTNVVLHVLSCILLLRVLLKMYKNVWAAFLSALLYSVHTIHTEAVTYTASRSDLLMGVLALSVLLLYWNSHLKSALFAGGLSLFVKESAVLIPVYLVFLEWCFLKSGFKRAALKLVPFFILIALFILYRKFICPIPLGPSSINWHDAALRFFSMGGPLLSYFQTLIAPEPFKFSQHVHFAAHFSDPAVWLTVFVLFLLAMLWLILLRYRAGGFFGLNFFIISLLPSMQIIGYYPEWAEHYLYVPFMGIVILLGDFLNKLFESKRRALIAIFLATYVPFILFLGMRTWQRNEIYNDAKRFYQALSQSNSIYAVYGYQNLARLAIEEDHWEDAIVPLKTALSIWPYFGKTHQLLGRYYRHRNDDAEALKYYEKAYAFDPENNEFSMNVGNTLVNLRRYEEAAKVFADAQKRNPKDFWVYIHLMASHELAGRPEQALRWGEQGLAMTGDSKLNSAILLTKIVGLAYRQRWDDVVNAKLDLMLQNYPEIYWYADIARLLKGKMDEAEFRSLLRSKYSGFESAASAKSYLLMSFVLNNQGAGLEAFIRDNDKELQALVDKEPLFKEELARAKEGLKLHEA